MRLPIKNLTHTIKSTQAFGTALLRGGLGIMGTAHPKQPEKALILYEHEACPYCRRVREVMTHLNLDYVSHPSPHKGQTYRQQLKQLSGATQVPYLVDENTGEKIIESQDIIDYLFAHYSSEGQTPDKFRVDNDDGTTVLAKVASAVSMMRGVKAEHPEKNKSRGQPEQLLELYGFEASPFCRLVREKLSALELGYINHNVARERLQDIGIGSKHLTLGEYRPLKGGKRERIKNEVMQDKMQFPYFVDPNTGTQMYESKDIIDYLDRTYG